MTDKGDIEAYPDGVNDPQNEEWSGGCEGGKDGTVTRTSTKSSWKDPGPPPDGGWVGWTQGEFLEFFVGLEEALAGLELV